VAVQADNRLVADAHGRNFGGRRSLKAGLTLALATALLTGCSSLGRSGPATRTVLGGADRPVSGAPIKIVDVNSDVARTILSNSRAASFAETLGDAPAVGTIIQSGDTIDIVLWEAPPAMLFGSTGVSNQLAAPTTSAGIPQQMVDDDGRITVPFAGSILVAGHTPQQVEREIIARLSGKAHLPQVVVRIVHNEARNITVIGEVNTNRRVPLTSRGERLLDAIAAAGGVKQPVNKVMIQVTRGDQVVAVPLETLIGDPRQNIRLQTDDVVTALFQPYSFTSLGATGNSAEINFEATGLTLSQALGRVGGLQDNRADIKGVFIFRLEEPSALDPAMANGAQQTPDGKIPVIYRVNLADPATFFIAQSFPIRNKDVLYVSNAPLTDIQKFVSLVTSTTFSFINIGNAVK
jgi:polysaccharide export outer membrane protein